MQINELNALVGKTVKVEVKASRHIEVVGGILKGYRMDSRTDLLQLFVVGHSPVQVEFIKDTWSVELMPGTVWG